MEIGLFIIRWIFFQAYFNYACPQTSRYSWPKLRTWVKVHLNIKKLDRKLIMSKSQFYSFQLKYKHEYMYKWVNTNKQDEIDSIREVILENIQDKIYDIKDQKVKYLKYRIPKII